MTKELIFVAAKTDEKIVFTSTKDMTKFVVSNYKDVYSAIDGLMIGGYFFGGFYSSLYSQKLKRWFPSYYQFSSTVIQKLMPDGSYHPIHARITLPMCSVFLDDNRIIIANPNDAFINTVPCMNNGFTGLVLDHKIWQNKLFIHAQTVKLYGDGLYFVYNYIGILNSDLTLFPVYETNMADVRQLERKYHLNPQTSGITLEDRDHVLIVTKLQLYNLGKRDDGVYLDDLKIYGG